MNLVAWDKKDQNKALIDPWTIVHGGVGLAAGLVNIPMGWAVTAAVFYEIFEYSARHERQMRKFFVVSAPESLPNQVLDVVVLAVGVWAGHKYNEQGRK